MSGSENSGPGARPLVQGSLPPSALSLGYTRGSREVGGFAADPLPTMTAYDVSSIQTRFLV